MALRACGAYQSESRPILIVVLTVHIFGRMYLPNAEGTGGSCGEAQGYELHVTGGQLSCERI